MGLVTSSGRRFGNSLPAKPPSPVCQELAARGADRLSATMKRGTGLSLGLSRPLARAAVERREASALPKRGARREDAQGKAFISLPGGTRGIYPAPFGAPPPFYLRRPFVKNLAMLGARTKSAARERDCLACNLSHPGECSRSGRASKRCRPRRWGHALPPSRSALRRTHPRRSSQSERRRVEGRFAAASG